MILRRQSTRNNDAKLFDTPSKISKPMAQVPSSGGDLNQQIVKLQQENAQLKKRLKEEQSRAFTESEALRQQIKELEALFSRPQR
jgi:regulator of replication initiation timing